MNRRVAQLVALAMGCALALSGCVRVLEIRPVVSRCEIPEKAESPLFPTSKDAKQ